KCRIFVLLLAKSQRSWPLKRVESRPIIWGGLGNWQSKVIPAQKASRNCITCSWFDIKVNFNLIVPAVIPSFWRGMRSPQRDFSITLTMNLVLSMKSNNARKLNISPLDTRSEEHTSELQSRE